MLIKRGSESKIHSLALPEHLSVQVSIYADALVIESLDKEGPFFLQIGHPRRRELDDFHSLVAEPTPHANTPRSPAPLEEQAGQIEGCIRVLMGFRHAVVARRVGVGVDAEYAHFVPILCYG